MHGLLVIIYPKKCTEELIQDFPFFQIIVLLTQRINALYPLNAVSLVMGLLTLPPGLTPTLKLIS